MSSHKRSKSKKKYRQQQRQNERKLRTFTDLEEWMEAVTDDGLKIRTEGHEHFAESDEDDTTMVGYYADEWGMVV